MYELEESKGMEEDEEQFSQEFMLPPVQNADPSIPWVKPKYYNRVKTGYEWNKYNQIHYDVDSPPPKVVQGYKFSIFYPDLYDKSTTPTYRLIPTENPELMILHFKAGPPYLDIAFKIVNGEWEYSQKTGFKCMYSNGILYLWFNFKKYRYRR
uniref:Splicing factor Cactin C-terminal domain-containing protein n=1 Tax=Arcella intermedia TaxID=1963864 RepID=A0A6B2LN79_9EUKA